MSTSYDGVFFYGLLFDDFGDGEPEGWPESTGEVFSKLVGEQDFETWLDAFLGVPDWRTIKYTEYKRIREDLCIRRFGVPGFKDVYLGFIDYSIHGVAPKDACVREWRCGRVPSFDADQITLWRNACEKLREVLPGADPPDFYYGCSVG